LKISSQKELRDNVVFETALFFGRLGRERSFLIWRRDFDLKLPSDLLGIEPVSSPRSGETRKLVMPKSYPYSFAVFHQVTPGFQTKVSFLCQSKLTGLKYGLR
jgi:hypothetical protein